jgi:OmpR-family two-component system manganese-sensing sensor histidine kinase
MFQTTRRRLALWYTIVTAILLFLFATGFFLYVRHTLVERIDDTLNHVLEVVQRSLVIEPDTTTENSLRLNLETSFRSNPQTVEDDHIDLEWFSPNGELLWSTLSQPLEVPVHVNDGETVHVGDDQLLRQVTQRVQVGRQVLGYLRVSHPWFEVTTPTRQLIQDLVLGIALMVGIITGIGWLLSGLAMAPIHDSYQRLKQFTADASHELRNPIAIIQTNVQVALADPDPDLQQQQLLVVERLTRRLGRLVDDLLFLARQDSGMIPMKMETVNLERLLDEVVEEQQAIATERQVKLQFIKPESGSDAASETREQVQGDRDQLFRLFTNLISNALQYTPPDGEVAVHLARLKLHGISALQIKITDTGVGIPSEAIPHLFDRFYRVDPSRSRSGALPLMNGKAGSGLGLAIAKAIVQNHHGTIQVDSTLNHGTTFTIMLPVPQRTSDRPQDVLPR